MSPLVRSTLAYIAGLCVPLYVIPTVLGGAASAQPLLLCAACAVMWAGFGSGAWRGRVVIAAFGVYGIAAGAAALRANDRDCRARIAHNGVIAFVGQPASLPGADGGFALRIVSANGAGVRGCSGIVRAKLPRGFDPKRVDGRMLRGSGSWMTFVPSTALPTPPERRGMLLMRSAARAPDVQPSRMLLMRTHAQRVLRATLHEYGLAEALVLAQREGVDRAVNDAFTITGMSHLLSISGTHVALVAALLIGLFAFLRLSGDAGRIAATIGVVLYVIFLGAPAAAARSALQVVLLLSGRILQRPADPYSVLAAAALALLVVHPLDLLDAGFQLSFAGVIGLIAYRGRIAARLPRRMPTWLRDGLAASLAASGVTMPIAAMQFGTLALVGIPASIIAVPLVGLALPAVAVVLLCATVSMRAARFIGSGTDVLLWMTARIADAAARVPGGHFPVSSTTLSATLLAGAAAVFAHARIRDSGIARGEVRGMPKKRAASQDEGRSSMRAGWRIALAGSGAVAMLAWTPVAMSMRDAAAIEIHAIDVGQGDAIAMRTPHGRWILIDTGPRDEKYDAGKSRVVPYLLRHGALHVDAIILSHPHADHIGGADAVMTALGVRAVIDPVTAVASSMYLETMRTGEHDARDWLSGRDGGRLVIDGVDIDILYPPRGALNGAGDANDLSVACRIRFGSFSALFMGDAPVAAEEAMIAEYGTGLRSSVLKVGHHGSSTSSGDEFLDAVMPKVALISVGRDNRYGHPNAVVVDRLTRRGIRVLRTDEHGSIRVRATRDGGLAVATQR